MTKIHLRSGF